MSEKTYTLTELVTNARNAVDRGEAVVTDASGVMLAAALGYPITEEGYAQFDADLTAAGL